jgi:hypothetical protein
MYLNLIGNFCQNTPSSVNEPELQFSRFSKKGQILTNMYFKGIDHLYPEAVKIKNSCTIAVSCGPTYMYCTLVTLYVYMLVDMLRFGLG